MYHIYISHSEEDRFAAALLAWKLKRNRKLAGRDAAAKMLVDEELCSERAGDQNYLIVICSFHSAKDPKIAEDIQRFYGKEPLTHIIPYVISGIPNAANPNNECLPDILKELGDNDILASNPSALGRRAALHRILSAIYGIPMDELEQRSRKQRIQRAIAAAAILVAGLAYMGNSEYTTGTHTEYYRTFDYVNGVPVGIDKLNPLERFCCRDYFLFRVNYRTVLSVEKVGTPVGFEPEVQELAAFYETIDAPRIEFSYHTDDMLDAAVHRDEAGNILFVINYNTGVAAADFSKSPDGIEPWYIVLEGESTDCTRCLFTYDADGYVTDIQYMRNSRNTAE